MTQLSLLGMFLLLTNMFLAAVAVAKARRKKEHY
jgi:hypothetical protein